MTLSLDRFQALFQQSAIAIQIYDKTGKCVEVNDAWETLFESKKAQLEGYNVLEDPQVHETGVIHCFRRAFAGEIVHVPATYYDPKLSGKVGRGRWLESIFSPVRDNSGEVYEVAILFSDITDLKLAQEELARSRDHFKTIFDHVPEGILVQDKNFKVVYANPAAAKLSGIPSPESWLDKNAIPDHYEFIKENGEPFPLDEFPARRALRGEPDLGETKIYSRNLRTGEMKTAAVSARPILDQSGIPYQAVSVFRDITENLRIERELKEALESKNLFFSVASHELRTPITAMKLNTQLLHLQYPQVSMETVTKLDRQVGKLSKLVEEMLDISRLARGRLELVKRPVNLSHLTKEVLYGMMDQLKLAAITVTMNIADDLEGEWDPDRLEQVLENLLTNAIRYARKCPLHVRCSDAGDKVILEVCDQGPGIHPEDHEKIFNRFERSRSFGERSGMGLGLFIVKEIVTLHGGTISASNLNTGGARFLIELPKKNG